jgi:hypothetical protein
VYNLNCSFRFASSPLSVNPALCEASSSLPTSNSLLLLLIVLTQTFVSTIRTGERTNSCCRTRRRRRRRTEEEEERKKAGDSLAHPFNYSLLKKERTEICRFHSTLRFPGFKVRLELASGGRAFTFSLVSSNLFPLI